LPVANVANATTVSNAMPKLHSNYKCVTAVSFS